MSFYWPYYLLRNGRLYDETNPKRCAYPQAPLFQTIEEAELWLVYRDIRGTVRPS